MTQPCDHTSVGILVFQDGKLLIIDRKRPPLGLAAPAGHIDKHGDPADTPAIQAEKVATAELQEETGLTATALVLVAQGRKENPCRRADGTWHFWWIYKAEAVGELKPSTEETRGHFWCTKDQMVDLLDGVPIQMPSGQAGLEAVWADWFKEIDVVTLFPGQ